MVQDTDGTLFGTTIYGGHSNACLHFGGCGTIFSVSVGLGPFVQPQPTLGSVGRIVKILETNLTGASSGTFHGTAAAFTVVSPSLITATRRSHEREDSGNDADRHAFEQRGFPGSAVEPYIDNQKPRGSGAGLGDGSVIAGFTCDAPALCCVFTGDESGRIHFLSLELDGTTEGNARSRRRTAPFGVADNGAHTR